MEIYPRILEITLYVVALYLFYRKQDLIIVYLPMLFFTRNLIDEFVIRQLIWYVLVTLFLLFAAYRANFIKKLNLAAVLLFVYFSILYLFSDSLSGSRSTYFSMICLMFGFVTLPNLYAKYGKEIVWTELSKMSLGILLIFVGNTLLCTATGYAPYQIYGRTTGVLYGNMGPTAFMALPIALFIYLNYNVKRTSIVRVLISTLALGLMLLSFRRTVQFAAGLAIVSFLFLLVLEGGKKRVALTGLFMVTSAGLALAFTDFKAQFTERYESRFGEEEFEITEEGRWTDHTMVFEDMFVHGRYSMLFGHSFFNSEGNYAGGIRGDRPLHPDIPVLLHASGMLGLVLYLLMFLRGFRQALRNSTELMDYVIWFFCLAVFMTYTFSGRITEASYSLAIIALLFLPVGGRHQRLAEEEERESPVELEGATVA